MQRSRSAVQFYMLLITVWVGVAAILLVSGVQPAVASSKPSARAAKVDLLAGDVDGFIVWSSNRHGNHDIFKMLLPGRQVSKLVGSKFSETYPRISPDGSKLVFSRSRKPRISYRNRLDWDVFLLDLGSNRETRLSQNFTMPRWISNSEISVLKKGNSVIRVNIENLSRKTIYKTGVGNSMPVGSQIAHPSLNPRTGQLVFTAKQSEIGTNTGFWGTAISKSGVHRGLHNGCEISWTMDGEGLFQVAGEGRQGTRIIRIDPSSHAASTMIDLDGEFSHEYWPKDSKGGKYLVFGASRSAKEHAHDIEDYEIFLWKTGSASSTATRLTYHAGNDNWPDIFINR